MKTTIKYFEVVILGVGLFASGCAKKHSAEWKSLKYPAVVAQLKSFVAEQEAQAHAAVTAGSESAMPEYKPFFAAAEKGDWLALNIAFEDLKKRAPQYDHLPGTQVDQRLR